MFNNLRRFLSDLAGDRTAAPEAHDERVAAAALLHHVIAVDGVVEPQETDALRAAVAKAFDLTPAEADKLVAAGAEADLQSVDLYSFTSVLKARMDEAGRERVVAMMWDMVYADGAVHEFEDNVLWRVAELLGISGRDRIRLKQAARPKAPGTA